MHKVSVLMSAFNAESYLSEAVDSVINQTFTDFEFIIVDDGSTDNTSKILDGFKDQRIVRLKNEKNIGLASSLNLALSAARGEFLARMDADDISTPNRFLNQVEYLEKNPDIAVLGTFMKQIDMEGNTIGVLSAPCDHELIRWKMLFETAVFHATVMMRKKDVDRVGGYDPNFRHIEDAELWSRMINIVRFSNLNEALYVRRWHDKSVCNVHYATQYQIGSVVRLRLFENILGRELSSNLIRQYSRALYPPKSTIDPCDIKETIAILLEAYLEIAKDKSIQKNIIEEIRADFIDRLVYIAKKDENLLQNESKLDFLKRTLPNLVKKTLKRFGSRFN